MISYIANPKDSTKKCQYVPFVTESVNWELIILSEISQLVKDNTVKNQQAEKLTNSYFSVGNISNPIKIFTEEEIQITGKHMKSNSTSLVMSEILIETMGNITSHPLHQQNLSASMAL